MRFGRGWDQFPSEESPGLAVKDPLSNIVKNKALAREKIQHRAHLDWLQNRRIIQAQNLARRKAERETVENVSGSIETPIPRGCSSPLFPYISFAHNFSFHRNTLHLCFHTAFLLTPHGARSRILATAPRPVHSNPLQGDEGPDPRY